MHTLFGISLILYMLKLSVGQGFRPPTPTSFNDLKVCKKKYVKQGMNKVLNSCLQGKHLFFHLMTNNLQNQRFYNPKWRVLRLGLKR